MKGKLKILYVASEIAPFAKTGGLADVASALPKTLFDMGHDIRVVMPKYGRINERKFTLREVIRLKDITIPMGGKDYIASVKSAFIPQTKVQVYFIDYKPYFDRAGYYTDPKTNKDYADNGERFAFFSYGIIETLKLLHWEPHVIHCNDWQTGLVPILLKTVYKDDPMLQKTKSLFSIHNLAFQGNFPPKLMDKIGVDSGLFKPGSEVEFYGKFSFLKSAISYADVISTVSPTYGKEIQSNDLGFGMEGVLSERKNSLFGILNGVDYDVWNPEVDEMIPHKYTSTSLSGKLENKKILAERNDLEYNEDTPIIGIISRVTAQKGFDLILDALDKILSKNVQLVILGIGDEKYHKQLQKAEKKYKGKIHTNWLFDDEMAHLIEAGADMFLMPSQFEPCGLNQIYSLKYGTIPIVRSTGGLADTVKDYNSKSDTGTGFVFEKYDSKEMLNAVDRSLTLFKDKKAWTKLIKRAMKQNYSWKVSAESYTKLYSKISGLNRKR